jgi:hypothetical protein
MEIEAITAVGLVPAGTSGLEASFPRITKGPPAPTKSEQSLEQLAESGDRLAIAKLKQAELKSPEPAPTPHSIQRYGEVTATLGTRIDEYD